MRSIPATPVLLPLITSADTSLRGTAVWALGALGAVAAVPRLRALLAVERSPSVVAQAQAALAILTAASATPADAPAQADARTAPPDGTTAPGR